MTKLPARLSRKAIKLNFTKVSEATWDYLFDCEKQNGIFDLRVPGPGLMRRPYYSTEGIMLWLVNTGRYTQTEFHEPKQISARWLGSVSTIHRIAR